MNRLPMLAMLSLFTLSVLSLRCSDKINLNDNNSGSIKEYFERTDDGRYVIIDRTGKRWDITHAVVKYGMVPSFFKSGLGQYAIKPIVAPKMLSPGDPGYPDASDGFLVLGAKIGNDARAYSIQKLAAHEIADETIANTHVAVAY